MVDFCTGISQPYSYCSGGLSCILTIHQLHRYFSRKTVFLEAPTQLEGSVMPEHACNNSSREQKGSLRGDDSKENQRLVPDAAAGFFTTSRTADFSRGQRACTDLLRAADSPSLTGSYMN